MKRTIVNYVSSYTYSGAGTRTKWTYPGEAQYSYGATAFKCCL